MSLEALRLKMSKEWERRWREGGKKEERKEREGRDKEERIVKDLEKIDNSKIDNCKF